ncbi:hypothetical protein [Paraliobacillus sp. JSM ZJ581]|uniref:hypothetical protein n=1 Tax=Paraliobacillus sp. JSM ZJ581 TaxID=3342118 RepID=UPI0035A9969F
MIQRILDLGWKKLLIYFVIIIISLAIIGFTIIFGTLLLMDKFDDRYQTLEQETTQYNGEINFSDFAQEEKEIQA